MKRLGYGLFALAMSATVVAAGPKLHLAFEDRGDPRPRQVAISAEIAGRVLALAISWTSHHDVR
jgi:hypothetical protein